MARKIVTDEMRSEFRSRYERGDSCPEIADSLGWDVSTVCKSLVRQGFKLDRRRRSARFGPRPLAERLAASTDRTGDCWLWRGVKNNHGYGQLSIKVDGRKVMGLAHRVAYEVANGPIPPGLEVRHACDTPACVRPDHLSLGNRLDNMRDMVERGRHAHALDTEVVVRIHEMTDAGHGPKAIGSALGLPPGTVSARQHRYRRTGT